LLHRGVACNPDNAALLEVARTLGEASRRALPHRSGLVESHGVQRVEALDKAPCDQFGQTLRSGHHGAFPLHSDEAFLAHPCRYVLLHCWCADPDGGGESLLASRNAIEASADLPTLLALRAHAFAYPSGEAPVLSPQLLRYNRAEIEGQARRSGRAVALASRSWLDQFDALFDTIALTITLAEGDLLLIDNHRVLHGRSAFAPGSPRLLKRIRVL
jgi:alpha-ketoglutarate-dependent taurine dioxygenase